MRILIIKLGALGDVLRTTPLLTGLKKKYPKVRVTWIVDGPHLAVLKDNPLIDELKDSSAGTAQWMRTQRFDLALNLDKEPEATRLLELCSASRKMGFARDAQGRLCAADALSNYAFRLGVDDELKFRKNQKTYQQISFEQAGLEYQNEEYVFSVPEKMGAAALDHLKKIGADPGMIGRPIIGLNTGSGTRFAGKKLPLESFIRLAERFHHEMKTTVFLLGGEDERERNAMIQKKASCPVVDTGSHPIVLFAAIVQACDLVVTGDTTAMHIAIAVKTPVVAYFASTCAQEIELYGRGRKIVSDIDCAPCYKKVCPIDEQCMKDMNTDRIFREAKEVLARHATRLS